MSSSFISPSGSVATDSIVGLVPVAARASLILLNPSAPSALNVSMRFVKRQKMRQPHIGMNLMTFLNSLRYICFTVLIDSKENIFEVGIYGYAAFYRDFAVDSDDCPIAVLPVAQG